MPPGPDGPRPIYLDHAATSWPKAPGVAQAVADALTAPLGNPGRSSHGAAIEAQRIVDATRLALARLVGLDDARRLVLARGCTDALHLAVHGVIAAAAGAKPHVVASRIEHNAIARPLHALAEVGRITLDLAPIGPDLLVTPESIAAACREDTTLVCVGHASNVTGRIQPIGEIAVALRERAPDAMLLVDAAQTVGTLPVDAHVLGADLLAFGGHKGLRGPVGIGGLAIGERAFGPDARCIAPVRFGGTGAGSEFLSMPDALPLRLEAGTPDVAACAGLRAALQHVDLDALPRLAGLAGSLRAALSALPGVRIVGPPQDAPALPILCVLVDGLDPQDLAAALEASRGVLVRAGLHCAPLAHEAMRTAPAGAVRISLGHDTAAEDLDAVIAAMGEVVGG